MVVTPRPGERFTEFYILGPAGNASGYPTKLNVSEPGTVILGVVNREAARVNYTVRVDLVGVEIVYNATSRFNETVERNRTAIAWFNATVADGANWTSPYTFTIDAVGLWKVQFLLFRDGDLTTVYRSLHRFVTVAAGPARAGVTYREGAFRGPIRWKTNKPAAGFKSGHPILHPGFGGAIWSCSRCAGSMCC